MSAPLLDVRALRKCFGGVVATDGVDLQVRAGEIHALIGPNGAGKTSLVAQLAGQLASDSGRVHFDGQDITRWVAHQRARRGLVRSFQITRLLKSLPVLDNLAFAVQATQGRVFAAWRPVRDEHALFEQACPPMDHAITTFLEDVAQRGLSEKILLVVTGEFGRTPRVNGHNGRDHWGPLCTLALAGGGLKMGQVVGESSPKAEVPKSTPIQPKHLMATIFL